MALNHEDFPTDPAEVDEVANDFINGEESTPVDVLLIVGQLDATEVDHKTMQPRWTESQRSTIIKANDALGDIKE